MDGGSSLNIMYIDTFKSMRLKDNLIQPSATTFHDIVPGRKAHSMGRVILDLSFSMKDNFRQENICFELVNFKSPYHCILGRPAFAKFMARPCYTYNRLKIQGPVGIIDVISDYDLTIECEEGSEESVECAIAQEELVSMQLVVDPLDDTLLKRLTRDSAATAFESAKDTMSIDLIPGNSKEQVTIGQELDFA
jgi:hypothetical protein